MKKSEDFDKQVREKLNAYAPDDTGAAGGWQRLRQSLKKAELEDQYFDQTLRSRLASREASHPSAGWSSFFVKYKERRARRRQILGIRIAELSLILLLFWTLERFHRQYAAQHLYRAEHLRSESPMQEDPGVQGSQRSRMEKNAASSTALAATSAKTPGHPSFAQRPKPETPTLRRMSNTRSTDRPVQTGPASQQTNHAKEISEWAQGSPEPSIPAVPAQDQNTTAPSAETQPSALSGAEMPVPQEKTFASGAEHAVPSNNDPATAENPANAGVQEQNVPPVAISEKILPQQGFRIWAAPAAGAGINLIRSPEDLLLGLPRRSQTGFVWQSGVALLFDHGRWILETGLHYAMLSHAPGISEVYKNHDGSFHKAEFNRAQYHILEIPVMTNLVVLSEKRLNWSIGGGMSVAANLHADFQLTDETTNSRPGQGVSNFPRLSYLEDKSYNRGLLHEDDFPANSFANLILCSRMNYLWRQDLRIFAEIRYKKMLSSLGFGPNQDQFRQIGLNVGMMVQIR